VKRAFVVPTILLLLCLLFPAAAAAGIVLTAGQQDYFFLTGQRVEIPLTITSTFTDDVPVTVLFSTDTELQKTGTVMISTENRVFTHTVPAGESFLNLTISPSQVSRDFKVHLSIYSTNPSPVNTSLPEIYIHIVTDPGLVKNTPVTLTSTSRPESGEIPSASSVSMVQQTVSTREQMGSDSSREYSLTSSQSLAGTEAEREQQQRDKEQREREQAEFDARLAQDPLVMAVNRSLAAEGFSPQSVDTQPAGNDTGTFSMLYRRGAEDHVVVQGSMQAGSVPSLRELGNVPITADPALDANMTFQSFVRMLEGQDYRHQETTINRTVTGAVANITYATAAGNRAYVNATTEENRVVQLGLEQETRLARFLLVAILMAAGILTVSGWYLYRRYQRRRHPVTGTGAGSPPMAFNHRAEAERILTDAEKAFARQEYATAYGLAGRALRVFLSYEYGGHGEVTATEIVTLLEGAGHTPADIESVLVQCSHVAFARGTPDDKEFSLILGHVREIIRA
jgi:hypothetical protein